MPRPNVLFLMVDQHCFKDLGYVGHPVLKTPNLDRLSRDAVHFKHCYVQNAFCLPSRTCYLTGQYLFHNRQYGFTGLLPEDQAYMPAVFRDSGYETFHCGKLHVNSCGNTLGFDTLVPTLPEDIYQATSMSRNYQTYCQERGYGYPNDQVHGDDFRGKHPPVPLADKGPLTQFGVSAIPARDSIEAYTADQALEFLGQEHEKPFFLHVSFDRPHGPWTPSPEWAGKINPEDVPLAETLSEEELERMPAHIRRICAESKLSVCNVDRAVLKQAIARYYELIQHIDHEIGKILDGFREAGLYDNTVVVFCADHGDTAGEKGLFDKYSNRLYHDCIIRTPFLLKLPGREHAGREVEEVVESIDIFSTLCDLCGVDTTALAMDGVSLLPLLRDKRPVWDNVAFSESYSLKAIVKNGWKLIYYVNSAEGELYDLTKDPGERWNRFNDDACQDKVLELKSEILRILTPKVSAARQDFIRSLFDSREVTAIGGLSKLFKWDKGVVEGGGMWQVLRDGMRLTSIPFDNVLKLERRNPKQPHNGTEWNYEVLDSREDIHRLTDELIDYICTKIRPVSIMIGSQEERDNMLQARGSGLC